MNAPATPVADNRLRAILTSDAGKTMPTLAKFLAFDTGISSEVSVKILEAAKADKPDASAGWIRAVGQANATIGAK
jgi:hypothetical protein